MAVHPHAPWHPHQATAAAAAAHAGAGARAVAKGACGRPARGTGKAGHRAGHTTVRKLQGLPCHCPPCSPSTQPRPSHTPAILKTHNPHSSHAHLCDVLADGLGTLQHVAGRVQQRALHLAHVPKDGHQQGVEAGVLWRHGAGAQGRDGGAEGLAAAADIGIMLALAWAAGRQHPAARDAPPCSHAWRQT